MNNVVGINGMFPGIEVDMEDSPSPLIEITFISEDVEVFRCDNFGQTEEMPGFIVFWDGPNLLGFYNTDIIAKIRPFHD